MTGPPHHKRLPFIHGQCPFCKDLIPGTSQEDRDGLHAIISVMDLRLVPCRSTWGYAGCSIIEHAFSYLNPSWRQFTLGPKCLKCNPTSFRRCREGDCSNSAFALLQLRKNVELCYPFRVLDDFTAGPERTLEPFVNDGMFCLPLVALLADHTVQDDPLAQDWSLNNSQSKGYIRRRQRRALFTTFDAWHHRFRADSLLRRKYCSPPRLPRRVLDLRRVSTEGKLHLLESEDERGVYVCLSYTWGPRNNDVTAPDNLKANLNEIPYDQLPQTYKDAVTVAMAFGVEFLWIDGLCIIQGDKNALDWKEQSSRMVDIHGTALLVFTATNCTGVEDGFLSAAQPSRGLIKFEIPRDTEAHS
ncbi:heterokaryon incompatibility protein [Colletotrichum incanum]|uniref:Heterokaryon incompatibility protein n=1 Tax=Colletotrichum incanum TaxID=1573173 RepID=A0A166RR24_COLIC|nr:heterokaryon incompatibility protein [Colletotrichum incanum]